MTQTKTKRILWTIAVLLALSLVAGMVLHKHEEPQVIGNLSKEDVKEISKLVLEPWHDAVKEETRILWHQRNIKGFAKKIQEFNTLRVSSIQVLGSGQVKIKVLDGTNEYSDYAIKNEGGTWKTAYIREPVSQSGAVK